MAAGENGARGGSAFTIEYARPLTGTAIFSEGESR
jgi:hypothetical protein